MGKGLSGGGGLGADLAFQEALCWSPLAAPPSHQSSWGNTRDTRAKLRGGKRKTEYEETRLPTIPLPTVEMVVFLWRAKTDGKLSMGVSRTDNVVTEYTQENHWQNPVAEAISRKATGFVLIRRYPWRRDGPSYLTRAGFHGLRLAKATVSKRS